MINTENIRGVVVRGLKDALKIPVIRSNQTGIPPDYPYLSYTITTLSSGNNGTWGEYEDGIDRKPVTQTWSITVQSDNCGESMRLCNQARDWLDRTGRLYLNDRGVIVQSVGDITNRDNLITISYEYRNGFDVVFWTMDEAANTAGIETIEEAEPNYTEWE